MFYVQSGERANYSNWTFNSRIYRTFVNRCPIFCVINEEEWNFGWNMNFCGGELGLVIRDGSSSFYSFSFHLSYLLIMLCVHTYFTLCNWFAFNRWNNNLHNRYGTVVIILENWNVLDNETIRKYRMSLTWLVHIRFFNIWIFHT